MKKLKLNYIYNIEGLDVFEGVSDILLVTRTFPNSDVFHGKTICRKSPKYKRLWQTKLEYISHHWKFKEIGDKNLFPEYFL